MSEKIRLKIVRRKEQITRLAFRLLPSEPLHAMPRFQGRYTGIAKRRMTTTNATGLQ